MPELPEVETIVRRLRPERCGRRIVSFATTYPGHATPTPAAVQAAVQDRVIQVVTRRAKFLVWELQGGPAPMWQLVHLRMSGRFAWDTDPAEQRRYAHTSWRLDDGRTLYFCDARKFGRVSVTTDRDAALAHLGPEPLAATFTAEALARGLAGRKRAIKPLLLDQSVLAGLGNIYTDESLWRARIHPETPAAALTAADLRRLHRAIRAVLTDGIRHNGTSFDWIYPGGGMQDYLRVYGRAGAPCPFCQTPIVRLVVGQRGTHLCPRCQPVVKPA